jgi:hypothetical protein
VSTRAGDKIGDTAAPTNFRLRDAVAATRPTYPEVKVEEDEVAVVELAEIDSFLADVGSVDVEGQRLSGPLPRRRLFGTGAPGRRCASADNQKTLILSHARQ